MKRVSLADRRPGWPRVNADVASTATMYEVEGLRVIGFVTTFDTGTIGSLAVGWDLCGLCAKHINRCNCKHGISAPPGVVYCYRQAAGIVPRESAIGGAPYIGLRHNIDGTVAPLVIDSPVERARRAAEMASDEPEQRSRVIRRRPRSAPVQDDIKAVADRPVLRRRRVK